MKKFFTLIAILALSFVAQAQSLKIATGGAKGTYAQMFKELSTACVNTIQMNEVASTGSSQNIDMAIGNKVNGFWTQMDVLKFRSNTENLTNFKTLVAMHPEEVHIVALRESKVKEGGTLGFGKKTAQFNTINDLAGRTVVAAGGSYITAQVIRLQTEINFNVLEVANNDAALKAVIDGTAEAAILVGGAPYPVIESLNKGFKLLSIPEATTVKLKNVYKPATVSYANVGAAGVTTIATDALFVVREYKTPEMVSKLAALRSCINSNVGVISETLGSHPSWSKVDIENQGKWAYMQLPSGKK